MAIRDLKNRMMRAFSRMAGDTTRRPDGGTSFYRPIGKKKQEAAENPARAAAPETPYIHTGFIGMNPPADPTGYAMAQDPTGIGNDRYTQPWVQPTGYAQTQPAWGQPTGYAQAQPTFGQPVYEPAAPRPDRRWFAPREEGKARGNISYMPGFTPDAGPSFTHVEHILAMTSLKACYEAIECMKNGETLIVTLDAIANDSESMRCQDMLAGAAFTLGCAVRTLQGGRVVVIAPENVKILPEAGGGAGFEMPVRPFAPPAETPPAGSAGRRERRSSANPDWNAARRGERPDFNPYTGSMPAAAGEYAAFGGCGY